MDLTHRLEVIFQLLHKKMPLKQIVPSAFEKLLKEKSAV